MRLTGGEIVWDCLTHEGVDVVFGYPGGATLPLYDALYKYPNIHHVLTRHEQGAAHMADGYARASGKVGVALATSGPGATNLVTGIANAFMDSVPTVFITGQVVSKLIGYDAFQEVDVTGITLPITKHNYLITDANEIGPSLRQAFHIARSGRPGPVLLDISKDAQQGSAEWDFNQARVEMPGYRYNFKAKPTDFEQAAALIKQAKKPVILAGRGILLSGAMQEVLDFAEMTQTPVAMTLLGISAFPASHPLNLGMLGMHGEAWVNHTVQEADLLLAFGMRFDDRVTGNLKGFAPNAKKIQFDVDASEINKNVPVDMAVIGDLRGTLQLVMTHLAPIDREDWIDHVTEMKAGHSIRNIQNLPDNGHLYAAHAVNDIWRFTGGNAILVTDVGQNQMWSAQYYKQDSPNCFISSGGLGTMGFGVPAGIGAKFACPEKEVWVIAGDGGFQMTQAELATCAQENIKINIAIMNNGYLGMVRQWQEFFYDSRYSATPMKSPDFVKIAEAHGLTGIRVESRQQVQAALKQAQQSTQTTVLDFKVEREDSVYPMVPAGANIDQMIRRPAPEEKSQ